MGLRGAQSDRSSGWEPWYTQARLVRGARSPAPQRILERHERGAEGLTPTLTSLPSLRQTAGAGREPASELPGADGSVEQGSVSLPRGKWALAEMVSPRPCPNSSEAEVSVCHCPRLFLLILPDSLPFLFGDPGLGGTVTPPAATGQVT